MKKSWKLLMPLMMLVLAAAITGCSAGQQVSAQDVIQKMRDTAKTTQSVQGTVDMSLTLNKEGIKTLVQGFMPSGKDSMPGKDWTAQLPDSASAQVKLWKQAASTDGQTPAKVRLEVVSSSLPGVGGLTFVFDGSKAYALDPAHNTLYTGTPEKLAERLPDEMKAAMQGLDMEQEVDKALGAADIKLVGTEKVAGLDTYKLDITPKPDAADNLGLPKAMQMQAGVLIKDIHLTLWVDTGRWIPLKLIAEHPNVGSFTSTTSAVELNKPIDQSVFVLQVGSGVKQVDLDTMQMPKDAKPQKITLPEARDAASQQGWKLLEATYPADATVVGVTRFNGGNPQAHKGVLTISYSSPSTDFTVAQSSMEMEKQLGDGFSGRDGRDNAGGALKNVTVRGADAVAFSPTGSGWTALAWQEKGSGIYVAVHGKLSLDEALKIAENLK